MGTWLEAAHCIHGEGNATSVNLDWCLYDLQEYGMEASLAHLLNKQKFVQLK